MRTYTVRFGYDHISANGLTTEIGDELPERTFTSYEEAQAYGREIRRSTGLLRLRYMVFSHE